MRRILALFTLYLTVFSVVAFAADMVEPPGSCKYCGMDRTKFSHSRMLVEYNDGTSTGTCSLHCMAVELANNIDRTPKIIEVADYDSRELTDAEKAVWVIGGSKPGVMTMNPKWAFNSQENAMEFVKTNGGKIAAFEEAIRSAYEDMYNDTRMIRDKRMKMKMKKQ